MHKIKMYFKILELFILKTLFNKGEYNITSKEFNPIKFFIILLLVIVRKKILILTKSHLILIHNKFH